MQEFTTAGRRWIGKVFIATSVDGFIARRDGDIAWLTEAPDHGRHAPGAAGLAEDNGYAAHMAAVDHVVMGRGTYEKVLTFDGWPYVDKTVIVLSTTTNANDERVTIARSIADVVALLDQRGARVVYVDGGATTQAFLRHGLIDSLVITRIPVLIGDGAPLFGPLPGDVHLVHRRTVAAGNGFVQSEYGVPRSASRD